jgi:hypothetical protein
MITNFKIFESEGELELGKYVIFKFPTNLIILEVISIEEIRWSRVVTPRQYADKYDYNLKLKRLYNYTEGNEKATKSFDNDEFDFVWSETKRRIVYDSDDLQHILDIAPTLFDVNKYNL